MSISAFVLIKLGDISDYSDKTKNSFTKNIKSINEVESVYLVEINDSPYSAIAKINTASINSLYNIILGKIAHTPGVKETKTMIVMDS